MSRAPRYSILFALPLLLGYEALAALLAQPGQRRAPQRCRRTAPRGVHRRRRPARLAIFMAAIILLGVGLVIRDMRETGDRLRPIVFAGMLAESVGARRGVRRRHRRDDGEAARLAARAERSASPLDADALADAPHALARRRPVRRAVLSRAARDAASPPARASLLGFGQRAARDSAPRSSARSSSRRFTTSARTAIRSQLQSFTFRMLSGLAFSGLYLLRGFGITAWTHALYDAFLLLRRDALLQAEQLGVDVDGARVARLAEPEDRRPSRPTDTFALRARSISSGTLSLFGRCDSTNTACVRISSSSVSSASASPSPRCSVTPFESHVSAERRTSTRPSRRRARPEQERPRIRRRRRG